MSITMRDIAEQAGVNVSTVSRVLRNTNDVHISEECRQRILRIAEQLNYRPNLHARALSGGKAPLINLVIQHSYIYISNLRTWKLHYALAMLEREVLITDLHDIANPDRVLETVLLAAPEAVVFLHAHWQPADMITICNGLHARDVHTVIVDYHLPLPPGVPADMVTWDRRHGVYLAVSHLLEQGHRHIGIVAWPQATGRIEGYERALNDYGIQERYVVPLTEAPTIDDDARSTLSHLFEHTPRPTALFCQSDVVAVAVMQHLAGMGLKIPDDVAVVGFDGEPWTEWLPVPLTTVVQPVDELCAAAAELLQARLSGDNGHWRHVTASPRLIVRQSSAVVKGKTDSGR